MENSHFDTFLNAVFQPMAPRLEDAMSIMNYLPFICQMTKVPNNLIKRITNYNSRFCKMLDFMKAMNR